MKKTLAILNLLSVIFVIAVNYASQALRLNETTIGEISSEYYNLFTPASYAFAIWGFNISRFDSLWYFSCATSILQ